MSISINKYTSKWILGAIIGVLFLSTPGIAQQTRTGVQTRNPQGALHVDGKGNNPKTGIPNNSQSNDDIIITDEGKIGVGTLMPEAGLDLRSSANDNAFGLGTTNMAASAAGAGALRYEENNKRLEFSDGVVWSSSYVAPTKTAVVAQILDSRNIPGNQFTTLNNWVEQTDLTNSFNPTTGVFTAPREGYYSFFLTYDFIMEWINYGTRTEARLMSGSTVLGSAKKTYNRTSRITQAGGLFHITVKLNQGQTAYMQLYQNIAGSTTSGWPFPSTVYHPRQLRSHSDSHNPNAGFNHLSIIEH